MRPGGWVRAVAGTSVVGLLAAACGAGAPPRLEVTVLRDQLTPAARELRAQENLQQQERAGADKSVETHVGDTVTARFGIRNSGGRYLVLHGLLPDCGCRLASALPDTLAPGAEAALTLVCRAPNANGKSVRESLLLSNDPARPAQPLRVEMAVAVPHAEPAALYFGYVPVGGSATRRLAVDESAARAENPDRADNADDRGRHEAVSGAGAVVGKQSITVADDAAISIEPLAPLADGKRTYRVSFAPRTTGVMRATLGLGERVNAATVSGVGFRTVLVFPPEVSLPAETTAGGPPVIAVKNVGDEPLDITGIELPTGITGDLRTVVPGQEYRLALRARGRWTEGIDAAIRLHTSAPDEPVVAIPVRYTHTPARKIPTAPADRR